MQILILLCFISFVFAIPVFKNPMINDELFEGDIFGMEIGKDRNALPKDSQRWPGGVIPYYIAPDIARLSDKIIKAMEHIEENTCIHFVPRTTEQDYIEFYKHIGCYSSWGRVGGMQYISLGEGCEPFGTIVHEIMHAVGFEHEHNRSDRDDYINIHWPNIKLRWQYAFKKLRPEQNRLLTSFDYDSIMLYGSSAFTTERNRYSMTDKNGRYITDTFNKPGLSPTDIKRIKMLYDCE